VRRAVRAAGALGQFVGARGVGRRARSGRPSACGTSWPCSAVKRWGGAADGWSGRGLASACVRMPTSRRCRSATGGLNAAEGSSGLTCSSLFPWSCACVAGSALGAPPARGRRRPSSGRGAARLGRPSRGRPGLRPALRPAWRARGGNGAVVCFGWSCWAASAREPGCSGGPPRDRGAVRQICLRRRLRGGRREDGLLEGVQKVEGKVVRGIVRRGRLV
jgi:hypothetical protein